jgi:hypothetical protein
MRLLSAFSHRAQTVKIEQLDSTFRFDDGRSDQTLSPVVESALEFIMRKLRPEEIARYGRIPAP